MNMEDTLMENTVVIELKKEDAERLMFLLATALQDAEVAAEKGFTCSHINIEVPDLIVVD
jgi:hypothetical protein